METNAICNNQDKFFEILKWVTPIILFSLGYLISELIRRRNHNKELRILKALLLTQLQQLHQQIQDQIGYNADCIKKAGSFSENDLRLKRHYGSNIERIRKIPFKDIFQILVSDPTKKTNNGDLYVDRFNKLFRIIDYFESGISSSYTNNDLILRNLNESLEKWNNSQKQVLNFRNLLVSTLNSQQVQISKDKFVSNLVEINNDFESKYGKNIQNIEFAFDELIVPMIESAKNNSTDPRSAYLMSILQDSKHAYLETKSQRKIFSEGLKELNDSLERFNPELKSIIEEIEKAK